jgi:hypothetical protein
MRSAFKPLSGPWLPIFYISALVAATIGQQTRVRDSEPKCKCSNLALPANLFCADAELGCVVDTRANYPQWQVLSRGNSLLVERTTLLMALSHGCIVAIACPNDAHTVLAVAHGDPAHTTILHHEKSMLFALQKTLSANALLRNVDLVHGQAAPLHQNKSEAAQTFQSPLVPPPQSLLEYYTDRRELAQKETASPSPAVRFPPASFSENGGQAPRPRLIVVQQLPEQHQVVKNAVAACTGQCSLVVAVDYDVEGVVFPEASLQTLDALAKMRFSHACFWHLSDWEQEHLSGQDSQNMHMKTRVADLVAPALDVVCLYRGYPYAPPDDAKIAWGMDVNRQLAPMVKAFAPAFAARYVLMQFTWHRSLTDSAEQSH